MPVNLRGDDSCPDVKELMVPTVGFVEVGLAQSEVPGSMAVNPAVKGTPFRDTRATVKLSCCATEGRGVAKPIWLLAARSARVTGRVCPPLDLRRTARR